MGTYHSHPYNTYFEGWAEPSNMDVRYSLDQKEQYMVIIALTKNKVARPLSIEYKNYKGCTYKYLKKVDGHDCPPHRSNG